VRFTQETGSGTNLIRGYSEAGIRINEVTVAGTCIVTADRIIDDFAPASFAELTVAHLDVLFALEPELVLLGTGPTQDFPNAQVRAAFTARRIGLESMQLGAACRTFNVLVQEGRRVAAALFLR
jgi:uncharacterized protein